MKKVMMLTTTAYMSERFNRSNICILEEMGYEVHVVANFDRGNPTTKEVLDEFKKWIEEHHGKWISISVTKHPTDMKNNGNAYKQLIRLIEKHQYEFIHCHTPVAGVLGRLTGLYTKTKVIYTAHGFHFFKGAPLKNWLLYYPVERFLSRWTDILITINQEDYQRAKRSFHAKKTEYIPGVGIDIKKFSCGLIDREEKRKSLGLKDTDIMFLSVGELNKNKNHQMVIYALSKLKKKNIHYVIVGQGILFEELKVLAQELKIAEQVHLLGYRDDVKEIYQAADIFVFPSKREGLSVALMEAIACRVPIICTEVRGNTDLIKNSQYWFSPNDKESLIQCIENVCEKDGISKEFKRTVEENYRNLEKYDLENVVKKMKEIYLNNKKACHKDMTA